MVIGSPGKVTRSEKNLHLSLFFFLDVLTVLGQRASDSHSVNRLQFSARRPFPTGGERGVLCLHLGVEQFGEVGKFG